MEGAGRRDFEALYGASGPSLVRQLYALTGDMEEARDVVQEAFARAWNRWGTVAACDSPAAWVRRVAYRIAVSNWRKARNASVAWARRGPEADVGPIEPDTVALTVALRALPVQQRRVIVLHYLADMSIEQICAETGSPAGSVKVWLSRGRTALAAQLRALDPAEHYDHGTEVQR